MSDISYTPVSWQDSPSTSTPLDSANLAHMEAGISAATAQGNLALSTAQEDEAAYAENITGTATTLATTAVDLGCVISVAATSRVVWLYWSAFFQVTAATNAGELFAQVSEITGGTTTLLISSGVPVLTGNTGAWSKFLSTDGWFRIGPTATAREFKLSGILANDSGTGLTATVRNSASAPTFLTAVYR